ncbi:hypothetical protein MJA45_27265 [Paenibacillus aurantius]|uniref:DUF4083 domain-containing protein n=1 Tax=Paenibacillus aurantius TaxID=2918900 RepID=A0AA96LCQ7_9BACL|nr:hypothetical protein [Paenibacillus aurantius]WNQ11256.1 hypothetical protein MJA45_27265 [Paenibacillus aurantius]
MHFMWSSFLIQLFSVLLFVLVIVLILKLPGLFRRVTRQEQEIQGLKAQLADLNNRLPEDAGK